MGPIDNREALGQIIVGIGNHYLANVGVVYCRLYASFGVHYADVIMTKMASQITSLTVVYSTVYSDADQIKHQSSASLAFVWGIHRDRWIPAQRASYAENVSIWWRHHAMSRKNLVCVMHYDANFSAHLLQRTLDISRYLFSK